MRVLRLKDIASQAFSSTGIGEKNTVSNGPDDGTNNCQASHWWNVMRHGSTEQMVNNLLTASVILDTKVPELRSDVGTLNTGAANVVGHGNEGLLETGMGQNGAYDTNKILLPWNEYAWGPQLDRLAPSGVTYISIWSCHTGAGQMGADLLYQLAVRCGRAVRAGTGFLYCSSQSFWWENGSQWQVATPNNKPNPIAAPSPHSIVMDLAMFSIEGKEVSVEDVVSLELTSDWLKTADRKHFEGEEAKAVARHIFRSPPINFKGVGIAGMVTAHFVVRLRGGGTAEFQVYNDRMAVDRRSGLAYYTNIQGLIARL